MQPTNIELEVTSIRDRSREKNILALLKEQKTTNKKEPLKSVAPKGKERRNFKIMIQFWEVGCKCGSNIYKTVLI